MHKKSRHRSLLWMLGAAMLLFLAACGEQETPTTTFGLTVEVNGDGAVTSEPAGIDTAAGDTSVDFDEGEEVTLTATAGADSTFDGWTGECDSTTGNECTVTMDAAKTVTATFVADSTSTFALDVTVDGEGTVTSDPAGIDTAAGDASFDFEEGTEVTLTATDAGDGVFDSWSGDCDSATDNECTITMDAAKSVTAAFTQVNSLSVAISTGDDDAEELLDGSSESSVRYPAGHTYTHSDDLEMTYDDGTEPGHQAVGLRFQGIDVPAGATITSASISFTADGDSSGAVTLTISGQSEADPATFNDDADEDATSDISSRPRTTEVTWDPTDWTNLESYETGDLSAIVQEIVDLGGWASGNAMAFVVDGPDAAPLRRAFTYDFADGVDPGTYAPVLNIEWE